MLCAVFTLALVNTSTAVQADSSNFAGPYVGLTASGYGFSAESTSSSVADDTDPGTDRLQIGKVAL